VTCSILPGRDEHNLREFYLTWLLPVFLYDVLFLDAVTIPFNSTGKGQMSAPLHINREYQQRLFRRRLLELGKL